MSNFMTMVEFNAFLAEKYGWVRERGHWRTPRNEVASCAPNILTDPAFQDECLEKMALETRGSVYVRVWPGNYHVSRQRSAGSIGTTKGEAASRALAAYYKIEVEWQT